MQKHINIEIDSKLSSLLCLKKTITINGNLVSFSRREFQCIELFAHGKRFKEVAKCLEISIRTVETYVQSIKRKIEPFFNGSIADLYWSYCRVPPAYLLYSVYSKES